MNSSLLFVLTIQSLSTLKIETRIEIPVNYLYLNGIHVTFLVEKKIKA